MQAKAVWPARAAGAWAWIALSLLGFAAGARTPTEWRNRTIYQILTDRFATDACYGYTCDVENAFCGGTWRGTTKLLDYIQDLGPDAVWYSPFCKQGTPHFGMQPYHGYWPADFYDLNHAFGDAAAMKAMIADMQQKGIWVMADMVYNHVGYGMWQEYNPFNQTSDFHNCAVCPTIECSTGMEPREVTIQEHCQLSGLPDLNHSDPSVADRLIQWQQWVDTTYGFDGYRIDAAGLSAPSLLRKMTDSLPDVWQVGELFSAEVTWTTKRLAYLMDSGALPGWFHFPLWKQLSDTLAYQSNNMLDLVASRKLFAKDLGDRRHYMVTFLDNHDLPRWLSINPNTALFVTGFAYILFAEGVPAIYYGSEASFTIQRAPLWYGGYTKEDVMWPYIKAMVHYRKAEQVGLYDNVTDLHASPYIWAFQRGPFVVVLTKIGGNGSIINPAPITLEGIQEEGLRGTRVLQNVLNNSESLTVSAGGVATIAVSLSGYPQIFYAGEALPFSSFTGQNPAIFEVNTSVVTGTFLVLLPITILITLWLLHRYAVAEHVRQHHGLPSSSLADRLTTRWRQIQSAISSCSTGSRLTSLCSTGSQQLAAAAGPGDQPMKPSARQASVPSAKGSELHRLSQAQCIGQSSDRMEAFPGSQVVFKDPGATSAADLVQGLRSLSSLTGLSDEALAAEDLVPCGDLHVVVEGQDRDSSHHSSRLGVLQSMKSRLTPQLFRQSTKDSHLSSKFLNSWKDGSIMHVALEYAIPHLGYNNQLMFGGLGMVVHTFIRDWPGPISVCVPMYRACYSRPEEPGAPPARVPWFLEGSAPMVRKTVDVAGRPLEILVYKLQHDNVTYYLIDADVFRERQRSEIYSFAHEDEMLEWLSVFNQSVAAVIACEGITHVQLHDYHGGMSLLHLSEAQRPEVLYVAHNAHYNAQFPVPSTTRRLKVYQYLGLNSEIGAKTMEHKGCVDMLQGVVTYLKEEQKGVGVVAVSPRYAKQIREKLSVFWRLETPGKPSPVSGILNALDMSDSLASSGMTLEEVLAAKREAKARIQEAYGLAVGDEYTLCVFVGRITHQKGNDIIAAAAPYIMSKHPKIQIISAGPVGDGIGKEAQEALSELSKQYPDRLHAPAAGFYVSGDEKTMVLTATDFCLIPSRFEPCGLVDIEFAWNGGLMIGHDTGGLGKVPGVYFNAEASHLSHLTAQLEAAVDRAMALSPEERRRMAAEALARRFPADEMMAAYGAAWDNIDAASASSKAARSTQLEMLRDNAAYFANRWAIVNKKKVMEEGNASSTHGVWKLHRPEYQWLSDRLLVVLQYFGLAPAILLASYCVLIAIVQQSQACGFKRAKPDPLLYSSLSAQVMTLSGTSFAAFPIWFMLVAWLKPKRYVQMACLLMLVSFLLVLMTLYHSSMLDVTIIIVGAFSLVGAPLLSLGFLGQDGVEVSDVGRRMMRLSEPMKFGVLALGALLAAVSMAAVPFLIVTGVLMLVMAMITTWFCTPGRLSSAYDHLPLVFKGVWQLLLLRGTVWLSLVAVFCDTLALVMSGYLVIIATQSLETFVAVQALSMGCCALAVLWNYQFLSCKLGELHINAWMLTLGSLPLLFVAQALLFAFGNSLVLLLPLVAAIHLFWGGRSSVMGLLAFNTLPSREALAIWQAIAIGFGSLMVLMVVAITSFANSGGAIAVSVWVPAGILMGLEALRCLACLGMTRTYGPENLSSP